MKRRDGDGLTMEPQAMRQLADRAIELLIERMSGLDGAPAWDGEFRDALHFSSTPPEDGRPAEEVLEQAAREVLPFAARLDHPRFFGFIPSSATWPGVMADLMASGFNINSCTWLVSSGTSQIELTVIEWMRKWIGYPETAGGLTTSGGSAASVEALAAAREAAGNPERPAVYMSDQTHSALKRASMIVGVRRERIRLVPTDDNFCMDTAELRRQIAEDRAKGLAPIAVCANAGTSSTGSIDPLRELAQICSDEGAWLHVDAAYGGFVLVTAQGKRLLDGIELADSVGLDAHKWFFQPYEAAVLMVKDVDCLERAFALRHDVLQDTVWGANHPNFADRGLQLSRSPRALKIWMSVQTFGMAKFREAVLQGMGLAQQAAEYVDESPKLELMARVSLGVVCFRVNPDGTYSEEALEELNRKVLARVFWDDLAFLSSTSLKGVFSLRVCILNHTTTWEDVRSTLDRVVRLGEDVIAGK